jgi:hypothetical protein
MLEETSRVTGLLPSEDRFGKIADIDEFPPCRPLKFESKR